jgi:hypothetical protein
LFVAVLLTPLAVTSADEQLTPAEAKEIAKEAFLWGMHPIAIYHLRYNFAQNELNPRAAGINRLNWDRTPMKDLPRVATTPIATTLYGVGMFDLPQEPAVIIVSEIEDRYWSVQLHDNYARWWHMVSLVLSDPSFTKHIDSHREVTAFAHFERLRLKVGTPFDPAGLTPEIAAAVEAGIEQGKQKVLDGMAANFTEATRFLALRLETRRT